MCMIPIELTELRVSKQKKSYIIIINIWLIQCYFILTKKFISLSRLAMIHKSINSTSLRGDF